MLEAAKAYREALSEQYERLRSTRASIASATREGNRTATDIDGLESRLKYLDEQLLNTEKQIAEADLRVANASAVPGAVLPEPPHVDRVDWDEVLGIGATMTFFLLLPFAIAWSRRIWRRSATVTVAVPPEVNARMQAMEDAIESVAVEVERIGEGQRFMTQALSDHPRYVGAGAAEPIKVNARDGVKVERPL
ncbi:MAG: hypothetical protein ACO1Q7_05235 [Gemmatimonas sp.]